MITLDLDFRCSGNSLGESFLLITGEAEFESQTEHQFDKVT